MQSIGAANGRKAVQKRRLIILCAPKQLGAHKMANIAPSDGPFRLYLGMWSDHVGS
jgi:hypothetical protein